jgi:hypothetical protein
LGWRSARPEQASGFQLRHNSKRAGPDFPVFSESVVRPAHRWFSAVTVNSARSAVGREYLQFDAIAAGMVRDKAIRDPRRAGVEEQQLCLLPDRLKTIWYGA